MAGMGFRDDHEAANARANALERELADRDAELARTQQALAELKEPKEADPQEAKQDAPAAERESLEAGAGAPTKRFSIKVTVYIILAMVAQIILWRAVVIPARCSTLCQNDGLRYVKTKVNELPPELLGFDLVPAHDYFPSACLCRGSKSTLERRGQGDFILSKMLAFTFALGMVGLVFGGQHLVRAPQATETRKAKLTG